LGLRWHSQGQECDKKEAHEGYISAGFGVGRDTLPLTDQSVCYAMG
jgi:ABC-type tungstate transport system permease subunit